MTARLHVAQRKTTCRFNEGAAMVLLIIAATLTEVLVVLWTVSVSAQQRAKASVVSGIIAFLGYWTNALVVRADSTLVSAAAGAVACAIACFGTLTYLNWRKRPIKSQSPLKTMQDILEDRKE